MKTIKKIFIHQDGYLRSTLQVLIAAFTFLLTTILGKDLIARLIYMMIENNTLPASVGDSYFLTGILPEAFLNFTAGFLIIMLYKLINKKSISSMGITPISKNINTIFKGMFTFIIMLSCITAVLYFTGNIKFTGLKFNISIMQYVLLMTSVSFLEEVLNRGFIQSVIKSRSSLCWALVIPSLVFASYHIANPGITIFSMINIFLAGLFFSLVTYKTGSIWFAFGAHIIWNVGCACIFGLMDVSAITGTILNFEYTNLTAFNGYGRGPLSGFIGTIAWVIMIVLFSKINRKRVA